mgnify:CR=1 FL=1
MALPTNVNASYAASFLSSSFATSVSVSSVTEIGAKINLDAANDTNFSPVKLKKADGSNEDYINAEKRINIPKFFEVKKGTLGWIDELFEKDEITKVNSNIGAGKKFDFTASTGKAHGLDWGLVILDDAFLRYPNLVWDDSNDEYVAISDFKEAFLYHWKNQSMLKFVIDSDLTVDTTMYEESMLDYIQKEYNNLGGVGVRTV